MKLIRVAPFETENFISSDTVARIEGSGQQVVIQSGSIKRPYPAYTIITKRGDKCVTTWSEIERAIDVH